MIPGMRLTGKRLVVTGGTAGIGLATVHRLVAEGARVAVVARRPGPGEALVAELGPDAVAFVPLDVTAADAPQRAIELAERAFGGLDGLVNNAAADFSKPLLSCTPGGRRRRAAGRPRGADRDADRGSRGRSPTRARAARSSTSRAASAPIGIPTLGVYGAAKGGINAITRHAAIELAPHGIRVNAVAPGLTETPLVAAWIGAQDDPEAFRARVTASVPQGRIARPEDVAAAIAFLLSDDAAHVTGAVLPVDGGYTAK